MKPRIVFFYLVDGRNVQTTRFQLAGHSQSQPLPNILFYVGSLDPQFSGSVIHRANEATHCVFLAGGLV